MHRRGSLPLMAASIFRTTLMTGLEWLVFYPEKSLAEAAGDILFTVAGRLTA